MRCKLLIAGLSCLLSWQAVWALEPLRMVANSSWTMPYGRFDGDKLVGGIVYDLAQAMEQTTAMPVTFVSLPRKRMEAAALSGDIDLFCYLNPKWTDIADQFVWSGRLFELSDVIFAGETVAEPKDLSEIPAGSVVSTVLGYGYPTLEPLFSSGSLKREDTVDQEKVMLKLSAGRTPYGVSDAVALNWYQRITPQSRLAKWRVAISRHDFQCGVPKKGNIPAPKILKALEELKKSGHIEKILQSYR